MTETASPQKAAELARVIDHQPDDVGLWRQYAAVLPALVSEADEAAERPSQD